MCDDVQQLMCELVHGKGAEGFWSPHAQLRALRSEEACAACYRAARSIPCTHNHDRAALSPFCSEVNVSQGCPARLGVGPAPKTW